MSPFDFFEKDDSQEAEPEVVQSMERSLNFWAEDKEDYPPAIRGVIAQLSDLKPNVQEMVTRIGHDQSIEDLKLKRVIWFEDKNDKLDEACGEAKTAFRPFKTNADGLISTSEHSNPLMDKPTRHRLIVSESFAKTNYASAGDEMFLAEDDDDDDEVALTDHSWKRKITQTLKPWAIMRDGEVVRAREPDDLMVTLNALFSRTKHGWLVADLFKLKKRRGSILTYARTYESQRKGNQQFEFMMELYGAAMEYRARLAKTLNNIGCLYLEIDELGDVYVNKVSTVAADFNSENPAAKEVNIPLDAKIVHEDGKPSQIKLKKRGKYFAAKLQPLVDQGKKLATKIDVRNSASAEKTYRFNLRLELDGPLLVGSSGNAVIFQLNDFLMRFCGTTLMKTRIDSVNS